MARGNLYSAYKAAGSTAGKYQGSWYAQQGIQGERAAESMISDVKVEGIQQTTAAITEGLGLVSNIYEGYKSKQEMATAAEGLGAVEQKRGFMDWFMGGEKSYKIGEDVYTGSQMKAKYEADLLGKKVQSPTTTTPSGSGSITMGDEAGLSTGLSGTTNTSSAADTPTDADVDITKTKLETELAVHPDTVLGKAAAAIKVGGEKIEFAETSESEKTAPTTRWKEGTDITMSVQESLKGLVKTDDDEEDDYLFSQLEED